MKNIHVIISGRVQGVFFRYGTKRKAKKLGLAGYVRNLPDSSVEAVFEGAQEKINEIVSFIKRSPGLSRVVDVKITQEPVENLKEFEIRY